MHPGNREFLAYLRNSYPENFHQAKVLELGSMNHNGSCRDHFTECEYTGIDIAPGPCVDIVVAAKNTLFTPDQFDTLISFSMVEHDPDWRESLSHNMQWLKSGGLFAMCWGAENNIPHAPFPWALVPFNEMEEFVYTLPLDNIDIFVEAHRYTEVGGVGAADLVAIKK